MVHTLTPTLSFPLCSAFFPRLFGDRTGICISNLLEKCNLVAIRPTNNFSGFVSKLDLIFYCTRFSSKRRIQDIIKTNKTFRTLTFSCQTKQNLFTRPRPRSEDHYWYMGDEANAITIKMYMLKLFIDTHIFIVITMDLWISYAVI